MRRIWAIFRMKNPPLYGSKSYFSGRNLAKIYNPVKENAASNTLPNGQILGPTQISWAMHSQHILKGFFPLHFCIALSQFVNSGSQGFFPSSSVPVLCHLLCLDHFCCCNNDQKIQPQTLSFLLLQILQLWVLGDYLWVDRLVILPSLFCCGSYISLCCLIL